MKRSLSLLVLFAAGACTAEGEPQTPLPPAEQNALQSAQVTRQNGLGANVYWGTEFSYGGIGVYQDNGYSYIDLRLSSTDPNSRVCVPYSFDGGARDAQPGRDGGMAAAASGTGGSTGSRDSGVPGEYCYYARTTYVYGYGPLPSGALQATNDRVTLNTTGISIETCTYDSRDGSGSCTYGVSGPISFAWRRTGVYSSSYNTTETQTWGNYIYRRRGSGESWSADASGTVLGQAITAAYGDVNRSQSVTRERTRK